MQSEKRHFIGCAIVASALMLFMFVSSYMEYAQDNRASMHLIAMLSGVFLCIFVLLVRGINKSIKHYKQDIMAQPVQDWYNG